MSTRAGENDGRNGRVHYKGTKMPLWEKKLSWVTKKSVRESTVRLLTTVSLDFHQRTEDHVSVALWCSILSRHGPTKDLLAVTAMTHTKKSLQHCCHWYWDDVKPGFQMSRCNFRVYWVFEASSKAVQNPSLISCSCTIKRCIWCMLSWISVYFVGIIVAHSSSFLLLFWFWANMNTWVVSILVCPSSEWGIVFLNMKLGFESASWK